MPNNCSTLIQRKQNILHKILRSNSEGKLQNAVAETTSELRVAGTRKVTSYSSSTNHITTPSNGSTPPRRTNLFTTNRIQPTTDRYHETHLPTIRDAVGSLERQQHPQSYDDIHSRSRPKTPLTNASPKSTARPPSASISSLFNALSKRSTENFLSSNGDIDELTNTYNRQSRRPSNESNKYGININQTPTKQTPQKHSGDSGVESRYSTSPPDATIQQYRTSTLSSRLRANGHVENPSGHETNTKERTNNGQLYQRRTNNNTKTPIKQKIDKYRRRSEEVTHAATTNGNTLINTANIGLSATTPTLATPTSIRLRPPPSTPTPVRRVTSDAEIQARLEVLRLSMESNVIQIEQQQQQQQQQQQNTRSRMKSPYLYSTHQQLAPPTTPQPPSAVLRRSQPISSTNHPQHRQTTGINHRRQQQSSIKQSNNTGQGNLYLAFIASRHLSTLEDTVFDCDIDHAKLLRIFTWLKNVEEYRHEQSDHDKLLIEQNRRMADQEDNLSLYSEIQYAVDDLPPNTSGKPCEKIATMQFED